MKMTKNNRKIARIGIILLERVQVSVGSSPLRRERSSFPKEKGDAAWGFVRNGMWILELICQRGPPPTDLPFVSLFTHSILEFGAVGVNGTIRCPERLLY